MANYIKTFGQTGTILLLQTYENLIVGSIASAYAYRMTYFNFFSLCRSYALKQIVHTYIRYVCSYLDQIHLILSSRLNASDLTLHRISSLSYNTNSHFPFPNGVNAHLEFPNWLSVAVPLCYVSLSVHVRHSYLGKIEQYPGFPRATRRYVYIQFLHTG